MAVGAVVVATDRACSVLLSGNAEALQRRVLTRAQTAVPRGHQELLLHQAAVNCLPSDLIVDLLCVAPALCFLILS